MNFLSDLLKQHTPSRVALVVLGMHRSGTSALAGVLSKTGYDLPKNLLPASFDNPKGYFESKEIIALNDDLFAEMGAVWSDWMPLPKGWMQNAQTYRMRAAAALRREFPQAANFVLKDPRLCMLFPFWKDVLRDANIQPRYVHIHRNPFEVAQSLFARDGLPLENGVNIWLRHILEAEYTTRGEPRVFLSYARLLNDWKTQLQRIEAVLDTSFGPYDDAEIDSFLSSELRHFKSDQAKPEDPNSLAARCYALFERWTTNGENTDDYKTLDALRSELDQRSADDYRRYGQSLARDGQQEKAEEVFAKACRLAPDNILNHTALGAVLMNARKLAEAHACFRYALNCAPEARSIHALIASTSLGLGAVTLAEHHARRALASNEGPELETDALARTILNTALLHSKKATETSGVDIISGSPDEQSLLAAMRELDQGEFESGLCDIAPLIEGNFEDHFSRDIFRQGFARFKNESEGTRFEEFVEALGLEPLADTAPASAQNVPPPGSIDIVIPVHNALDDLKICIASIRKWPSAAMGRIIVVNDASDDLTRSWMEQQAVLHADIHLIHTPENLGFTRTVMAGIRNSYAPFAVMLNSDTVVTAGWLEGLWRAINRRNTAALAGPLTNNGYYQTIQPYETSALADTPDRMAAMVLSKSRDAAPVVPLLSGFCLLVRRDAFDAVGGLDEQGFPWGYWEVQDLCLKLKDAGFEAVIADDVYVHHSGSKSIATAQKKLLTSQGFDLICERYSAIRLHAAEALCAIEPTIWRSRQAWANLESELVGAHPLEDTGEAPEKGPVEFSIIKQSALVSLRNEICLFVAHAPLGTLSEYTLEYIQALRKTGITVLVCIISENMDMPVDPSVLDATDGLVLRQNLGYDFAAWADMLRNFPEVWQAERLYFVNDSITGPFRPLDEMISNIRHANAGFFALSECTAGGYHAQSFFFGWNRENLCTEPLREFWQNVAVETDKLQVILKYEHCIAALSPYLPDPTRQIVFGMLNSIGADADQVTGINPTHHAWQHLLHLGFPFIKTDLLRDGVPGLDTATWEETCAFHGADVTKIYRHLEQSRINRLRSENLWGHLTRA